MELQGINKYPVLHPQGHDPRLRLAPVHHVRAQPQDAQLQYVAFGDQNGLQAPIYHHTQIQRQPPLNFIPVNRPIGQPNLYAVPQAQVPANYYYVQNGNNANEYYKDTATTMSFTQQPEDLSAKYAELEAEAEKYKGVSCVFKGILILTGLAMICLTVGLAFAITDTNPCGVAGRRARRMCGDALEFMDRDEGIVPLILILCSFVYCFYKFALKAYVQRRASAMNGLYYVFGCLFVLNVVSLNPINLILFGYLTRSANKLRVIFAEMETVKTQMAAQTQPQTVQY